MELLALHGFRLCSSSSSSGLFGAQCQDFNADTANFQTLSLPQFTHPLSSRLPIHQTGQSPTFDSLNPYHDTHATSSMLSDAWHGLSIPGCSHTSPTTTTTLPIMVMEILVMGPITAPWCPLLTTTTTTLTTQCLIGTLHTTLHTSLHTETTTSHTGLCSTTHHRFKRSHTIPYPQPIPYPQYIPVPYVSDPYMIDDDYDPGHCCNTVVSHHCHSGGGRRGSRRGLMSDPFGSGYPGLGGGMPLQIAWKI